jgi:hypothetical protein
MGKRILNCGSADTHLILPEGWEEVTLDIDERAKPNIVGDFRDLPNELVPEKSFDGIYASHVIEHVYEFEVPPLLSSFHKVAREYIHIRTPDILACAIEMAKGKPISAMLYKSPAGPVSIHDLMYGYGPHIEKVSEWYRHKCGFTEAKLSRLLKKAGFHDIEIKAHDWELEAIALV